MHAPPTVARVKALRQSLKGIRQSLFAEAVSIWKPDPDFHSSDGLRQGLLVDKCAVA